MVRIVCQDLGSSLVVGIKGREHEEILHTFYSFWNHGATDGNITWFNDLFGYFWSTREKFEKAMLSRALFVILNENPNRYKGSSKGALPRAKKLALEWSDSIEQECFIRNHNATEDPYQLGRIEADINPDE